MKINLQRKINSISILGVIKIVVITFVAFSLVAHFIPYYNLLDPLVYGFTAIGLTQGQYEITNELLEKTGDPVYIPTFYAKSVYGTAVPFASSGMVGISALAYLLGGYYGLFYLGPLFTILLLIISERVATKLFGSLVGLFTLVFVASSNLVYFFGLDLMTDSIFSVFFILGYFYLIKFFHEQRERLILLSTIFFVTSASVRFIGMSIFPTEILLILGYFIAQRFIVTKNELISTNKSSNSNLTLIIKHTFSQINRKKFLKISTIVLVPWLIYFSFWFSYNSYFYGDPYTNYYEQINPDQPDFLPSLFTFNLERFESLRFYLTVILPDELNPNSERMNPIGHEFLGDNWQSIISFFVIVSAITIAMYSKTNRIEIIVLTTFVTIFLLFYSSEYARSGLVREVTRFMIPVLPFSFMLFSYIIFRIGKINLRTPSKKPSNNSSKVFRITFFVVIAIFLFISLWNSSAIQNVIEHNFEFRDPQKYLERFPVEKLSSNSILVDGRSQSVIEYNVIPFIPLAKNWVNSDGEVNIEKVSEDHVQRLKTLIEEGYDAYTFKKNRGIEQPSFFRYLEAEHGIILKDYSKTFCKMVIIENQTETSGNEIKSDDICYMYRGEVVPKKLSKK